MSAKHMVKLLAPAKINLYLDVLGKRPDGYHDIETLFAKISLCDELTASRLAAGVRLKIINKSGCRLSAGGDNLVCRAARAFMEEFKPRGGVSLRLVKRIPIGAGLGGGSSDAAATLRALSRLYSGAVRGSTGRKRLERLALKLGSDVPFFMRDDAFCAGRGRGERLSPVDVSGRLPDVLVAYPGVPVPTSRAYALLGSKSYLTARPNLNRLIRKLKRGVGLGDWGSLLYNRFESAVLPRYPAVKSLICVLRRSGDFPVLMSGSGSCVFALIPQHKTAVMLSNKLRGKKMRVFPVRFLGRADHGNNRHTRPSDERGEA